MYCNTCGNMIHHCSIIFIYLKQLYFVAQIKSTEEEHSTHRLPQSTLHQNDCSNLEYYQQMSYGFISHIHKHQVDGGQFLCHPTKCFLQTFAS